MYNNIFVLLLLPSPQPLCHIPFEIWIISCCNPHDGHTLSHALAYLDSIFFLFFFLYLTITKHQRFNHRSCVCTRLPFKHKTFKSEVNISQYLVCATPLCTAGCRLIAWEAVHIFWSLRRRWWNERFCVWVGAFHTGCWHWTNKWHL